MFVQSWLCFGNEWTFRTIMFFFCRRFLSMKELFVQTWFFVFLFLSNDELFVQSWLFSCFLVNEWTFRAIMTFCFCLVNEWTVRAITILEFVFLCVCQKNNFSCNYDILLTTKYKTAFRAIMTFVFVVNEWTFRTIMLFCVVFVNDGTFRANVFFVFFVLIK